jgi:hypothetical protein
VGEEQSDITRNKLHLQHIQSEQNVDFLILKQVVHVVNHLTKLHGLSPRANYTDRVTAACRRSDCQLVRIVGATWSA